jgi:hypothetical protein
MTPARRSIALVVAREIAERIRGRGFLVSTLAIATVVAAAVAVPGLRGRTPRLRAGANGARRGARRRRMAAGAEV